MEHMELEVEGRHLMLGDQVSPNNARGSWLTILGIAAMADHHFVMLTFGEGKGGMEVRSESSYHVRRPHETVRHHQRLVELLVF
jgi:hypothetical protein